MGGHGVMKQLSALALILAACEPSVEALPGPAEGVPQRVNPPPGSLGLDPIAELKRNAMRRGEGAAE